MEFRILGPIQVVEGKDPVALGGPKQRTVLAHLILRANRAVSAELLIDEVWGEDPPPAAKSSLQSYVSHLRNSLGPDRLEGRSGAYVLNAGPKEIDALRFEALVERARKHVATDPVAGTRAYTGALALWRGPALDDLSDQASLRPEIARLEELRIAATEERMAAELDLGRHAELVSELEALTQAHPLRERIWGHLMVALYRCGRQADALATFEHVRELLADELGIDPSLELQRQHERILRQDPALEITGKGLRGYQVLDRIGAGAFGTVHRAFQPQVGREVAVKVIHPRLANDPEFIRRFEAEAQLVARLEHPHIVPLYDFWREPDGAYLVMRYLRGGSLTQNLARGALTADEAAGTLDQVALALAAAHREGVVHRDVKPANILFDEEGNAYLSDFGIAKDLAAAQSAASAGAPSPVAYYLSPEEIRGEPATPATDVYGLGVLLYEALAGRHPFAETPPEEVIEKHLRDPLPSICAVRPELPAAVAGVIERATAKDAADRYPEAPALATAFRSALSPAALRVPTADAEARNPYKGLRPFLEADAGDYFGREKLVGRLVGRMTEDTQGSRFLAVLGPSGSGKSSVVRAGLVPALRAGAVPGSERWFVAEMLPGQQPFEELEAALLRIAPAVPPPSVMADIERDAEGLIRAAAAVLPDDNSELLLVIDQFEELFTLVDDEGRRARFLANLTATAIDPRSRLRVIVTFRADFYDRPLLYEGFGSLLHARTEVVVPLTAPELERAIVGPAERVGATVAPALAAQLIADVADQPRALPLLQFTLTELFERRVDGTLTLDAYREMGGSSGGLARRAEEIFDSLAEQEKEAARQLFLRLVVFGEGTEDTVRRILQAELLSLQADPSGMHTAIDAFGRARLLSFDRDTETRGPTVEVAHAALLREWSRLREWIDTGREDLRIELWVASSAREWTEAKRDPSYLISGSRLEQLEAWREKTSLAVAPEELEFLEASIAQRDLLRAGEATRRARERTLERRSLRRLRALVAVLTVAALISGGLTVFASRERERAERQERIAIARELASAALANLEEDAERSILLALEAVEQTRSVDGSVAPEAEDALHRAVGASRIELRVPNVGGGLDWSPQGTLFATEGPEESGLVDIRDTATGDSVLSFRGHDVDVNLVAFSDDGSMLATTGDDGAARVWDPATGRELWAFESSGQVWGPSFSPDGSLLAAAWWDEGVVRVWDLTTGRMVQEIGPLEPTVVTSFSPDGRRLAIPTRDSGAVVVDVATGKKVFALRGQLFGVGDADWSPDSRWIATSSIDSTVRIWEADTGTPRFTLFGHSSDIVASDWSPDSTHLVTGSGDGTAKVWEITEEGTREVLSLSGQERGGGLWVAFSPDGQRVMTGDQQMDAVKIWDVSTSGDKEWANLPAPPRELGGVAFTPDGRFVVASGGAGSVTMWDAETAKRSLKIGWDPILAGSAPASIAVDVSPDGGLIAGAGSVARVWDAKTGEEVFAVRSGGGVEDVAWNSDGTLLATASFESVVKIVDRSGQEKSVLRGDPGFRVSAVRFSPDGHLLATARIPMGRPDPTLPQVEIWDWESGRIVTRIEAVAEGVAFDPTGRRIATASLSGPAKVWDTNSGRQVAILAGHTGAVNDIEFSRDGTVIATASTDGTVRLWDPDSGVQTLVLRGHKSVVWDVAFSPDGSKLVSSSPEGTVRVWALDLDDLIDIAKSELTRGFTEEECRQYLHTDRCG